MTIADTIFHNQYLLKDIFSYALPACRYCDVHSAESIAERGLLKLLQLKSVHYYLLFRDRSMDLAAKNGHLETVQWLHAKRTGRCTTNAMDLAAENGHLEIVQWLHENCAKGCSVWGMSGAAENGHLHVVKWLHTNRTESCTTTAMNNAAANGQLRVIKWLHKNLYNCTNGGTMIYAARNGHLDVVKWLFENCGACSYTTATAALSRATCYGQQHVVEWLQQKMNNRNGVSQ